MLLDHARTRGFRAPLFLGLFSFVTAAGATTPARNWVGADRLAILCQVSGPAGDVVAGTLCARVKTLAERDAPVPVEIVGYGSAALRSGNTMALLVQGAVTEVAAEREALIFTLRTERSGGLEPAPTYFGAAPRVAPFTSAADGAAWDAALSTSLSEILPWLRPAEPGELSPIKRERN